MRDANIRPEGTEAPAPSRLVTSTASRLTDAWIHVSIVAVCLTFTVWAGRDLNWDLFNYHYYSGYSFFSDRLDRDFMAASFQSYLNPAPQAPFFLLVSSGAHSLVVGLLLAAFHSLNLVLLYEIARRSVTGDTVTVRNFAILATVLGATTPIFWVELGTSFADVSTSVFVLSGILVLLQSLAAPAEHGLRRLVLAGLLIGCATGLKLTNVVYVLPTAILTTATALGLSGNLRRVFAYATGNAAGILGTHGYWSYRLNTEFGNPFFPLFNGIFESTDFPTTSLTAERFTPSSILDALELPLRLADLSSWVYTETVAPDLRVIVLCVFILALVASTGLLRLHHRNSRVPSPSADVLRLVAVPRLTLFSVAFVPLWLLTSANGRYAVAFLLLVGPVLAGVAWRLLGARTATRVLVLLIVAQSFHVAQAGNPRWAPVAWAGTWFEVEVPDRLRREPALYLAVSMQPNAFVVPWLHPGSAYVNVTGQHSIGLEGPGSNRLRKLLVEYAGRVRVITRIPVFGTDRDVERLIQDQLDAVLARLNLKTDRGDCLVIRSDKSSVPGNGSLIGHFSGTDSGEKVSTRLTLITCALVPGAPSPTYHQERDRIVRAFDAVEKACPSLFKPAGAIVESGESAWVRYYMGTDIYLVSTRDRVYFTKERQPTDVDLGDIEDWLAGHGRIDCRKAW
jgi:hypothetical protein